jgi:hypothetical protein
MKKAIGYVHKGDMFTALKIPFGLQLIGVEYPSKNGKVKITLQGDSLPVDEQSTKRLNLIPEINYEVQGTWHQARVTAIEPASERPEPTEPIKPIESEPKPAQIEPESKLEQIKPKEDPNHGKKRKYTKKSQRDPDISGRKTAS